MSTRLRKEATNTDFRARSVGKVAPPGKLVSLTRKRLSGADFSGRDLLQFASMGSVLERCRFDDARIDSGAFGAGRTASEYIDCSFDRSHIRFGPGGFARFVRCSFRDAVLSDWFCFAVQLVDCTFSGVISHSFFNGTVPEDKRRFVRRERNEFTGNDFSAVDLKDVGFRTGIDLTRQALPTGKGHLYLPDATASMGWARSQIALWPDGAMHQAATSFVESLGGESEGGQRQLLLRVTDFHSIDREVVTEVFALLREHATQP
jgi:uncharacterized protein YjbI with pentapeptide repeats